MPEKVFLKRYASRRLYDTESSSYVTLGQVSDMIRGGRQVQVVDAKTDEDVTAFILSPRSSSKRPGSRTVSSRCPSSTSSFSMVRMC
jgi:hypothetical protein